MQLGSCCRGDGCVRQIAAGPREYLPSDTSPPLLDRSYRHRRRSIGHRLRGHRSSEEQNIASANLHDDRGWPVFRALISHARQQHYFLCFGARCAVFRDDVRAGERQKAESYGTSPCRNHSYRCCRLLLCIWFTRSIHCWRRCNCECSHRHRNYNVPFLSRLSSLAIARTISARRRQREL